MSSNISLYNISATSYLSQLSSNNAASQTSQAPANTSTGGFGSAFTLDISAFSSSSGDTRQAGSAYGNSLFGSPASDSSSGSSNASSAFEQILASFTGNSTGSSQDAASTTSGTDSTNSGGLDAVMQLIQRKRPAITTDQSLIFHGSSSSIRLAG